MNITTSQSSLRHLSAGSMPVARILRAIGQVCSQGHSDGVPVPVFAAPDEPEVERPAPLPDDLGYATDTKPRVNPDDDEIDAEEPEVERPPPILPDDI